MKDSLVGKTKKLGGSLILAMLFVSISPLADGYDIHVLETQQVVVALLYSIICTLCGVMVLYVIEITFEKWLLREQLDGISEKYLRGEDKLQQVMDIAPICMVSVDRDGIVTSINDMMMTLYQSRNPELKKSDVLGRPIWLFVDPQEEEHVSTRITQALRGEKTDHELVSNGSRVSYMSTSPLTNSYTGEVLGAVMITQDMTELERLRSELGNVERLSLVGQMAASITHEIRNPMAVVRGFLQLMKEKSPNSLDHYYRIVMEELDRANSIINDFLSLAQNRVSEKEECYIDRIINDLSPLLWADANLRGQTIELELDENAPKLMLNAKEIKQLILNLARNGMEAMGEKGQLILRTRATPTGVEFIVQDNGSGIPKNVQDKLFTPFYSTKEKGTGLGLSLCLTLVERHKGKITVDSEEGVGTSIIVNFPRSYASEAVTT
ncbi:two-component system sensor histidine kinase NtrB [Paenibacillus sp. DS2015]|uniref:two-component system sensor histidine kinase NtrB n=1 Tax=Paenibacillus sp. DS2015 TaxID=3373917 RepID=UPI003D199EB1